MSIDGARWGIVLAGGSGRRLHSLTADSTGTVIPKQFCSVFEGPSLLTMTIRRVRAVVDPDRILVVVAAGHRRWWEPELRDIPPENIVVQPCDRGTACGVLLPLTSILYRDRAARVVVAPSDHYVRHETTLRGSLLQALAYLDERPHELVLLGMEPDRPDTEYGWITPCPGSARAVRTVASFVEKPDMRLAERLMQRGSLWSSFTFVATGETLMDHFLQALPWLVDRFTSALEFVSWDRPNHVLLRLYDHLPTVDFSQRVLQLVTERLCVLAVPACGWTDLGTPQRLVECIRECSMPCAVPGDPRPIPAEQENETVQTPADRHHRAAPLDLARAASRVTGTDLRTPG
jgi:mannose-1-phosphate guanylyltransferase